MKYITQLRIFNQLANELKLNGNTRAVYYYLLDLDNTLVWRQYFSVSMETMADKLSMNKGSAIANSIHKLEELGFIRIFKPKKRDLAQFYEIVDLLKEPISIKIECEGGQTMYVEAEDDIRREFFAKSEYRKNEQVEEIKTYKNSKVGIEHKVNTTNNIDPKSNYNANTNAKVEKATNYNQTYKQSPSNKLPSYREMSYEANKSYLSDKPKENKVSSLNTYPGTEEITEQCNKIAAIKAQREYEQARKNKGNIPSSQTMKTVLNTVEDTKPYTSLEQRNRAGNVANKIQREIQNNVKYPQKKVSSLIERTLQSCSI